MAQQQPPAANYGSYVQPRQQVAPPLNGNQPAQQNGFPNNLPSMKPMQVPAQQMPPTINYQNFQTKAMTGVPMAPGLVNGSNSALSSRTSSPGVQPSIPQSQLPPSRSYPSYQQTPQQPPAPSSQLPMAPLNNNNNNNNPGMPLSASMKNLSMNQAPVSNVATPPMPQSKSDQNFLNNNNGNSHGIISNPTMPPKTNTMAKRPLYPAQQPQMQQQSMQQPMSQINQQPMPQMNQQPMSQMNQQPMPQMNQQPMPQINQQQPQGFNSFPGNQQPMSQPQMQQPRGNLQYQNFPAQPQPQPQQQQYPSPGSIVQQGFSKMWGNDTIDLMQNRHILPPTKVLPPTVKLNHQFHEATNCSTDIFRCTLTKIPESNSLLQKSRLPLGILIHPYRDLSVSFEVEN
jgi:protein transport protein SEC24